MESVYYYEDAKNKDVLILLDDDFFKRLGYIVRECKLMESQRKGSFLYIKGSPEEIDRAEKMFESLKLLKLEGEENKKITAAFVAEEESAACGMGMIFG
jgi:magnesium-transporting ATPase (P-type)